MRVHRRNRKVCIGLFYQRPVQPPVSYTTTSVPHRGMEVHTAARTTQAVACPHILQYKSEVRPRASPFFNHKAIVYSTYMDTDTLSNSSLYPVRQCSRDL